MFALRAFLDLWIRKRNFLLLGSFLFLVVLSWPFFSLYFVFNQANLAYLKGQGAIASVNYQKALAMAPTALHIRWRSAKSELAANDNTKAATIIEPLINDANQDPLLFADIVRMLSNNGQSSRVVALYEANKTLNQTAPVSDTVALAYLEQGKVEKAFALRPTDLYLTNLLWQQTQSINLQDQLLYFPRSAIESANPQILKYTGEAILNLLKSNVWTRNEAAHLVAYLIWQAYPVAEVEQLLQKLRYQYTEEPVWSAFATELMQRRAQTPAPDPWSAESKTEKASKNLVKSTRLNNFDRLAVAKGDVFWHWSAWQGADKNSALFFAGLDPLESSSAVRMLNLWQRPPKASEPPGYAEYRSEEISLEPNTEYTLALRYKTDPIGEAVAFVALLDYTNMTHFMFTHTALPGTAGHWQTWQVSGKSYPEPVKVQLLLRMLGTGSVWFDDVQLLKGGAK